MYEHYKRYWDEEKEEWANPEDADAKTMTNKMDKTVMGCRGYACIGLDNPKTPANIGSAMRAVGVYGAAFLACSGRRFDTGPTDTMKHYRHIPFIRVNDLHSIIPYDCVPVAVDLLKGAIPLPEYKHPERAFYIFGAEDATLSNRIVAWCRDTIIIPTCDCMNLAATVNVVLYDRMAKKLQGGVCRNESRDKIQR